MTDFLLVAFVILTAGVIAVPIASRFGLGGGQVIATIAIITAIAMVAGEPWQSAIGIGAVLALS